MSGLMDDPNRQAVGLEPIWTGADGEEVATAKGGGGETDLDEMTKEQLLEHAQQLGVTPANHSMTKDELRAGIDDKLAEEG